MRSCPSSAPGLRHLPRFRRDGQREDRGVLPRRGGRPGPGPRGVDPDPGDRAHAISRARGGGAVRAHGGGAPQRPVGRRAPRPVVADPGARDPRRHRRAVRDLRAGGRSRSHRRGRGARGLVQAGREPALPRPRRGRDAGNPGGDPGDPRLRHAVGRVLLQRAEGQVPAAGPAPAHRRAGDGPRRGGGPPGDAQVRERSHPDPGVARRAGRAAGAPRAGAPPAEPPRLCHEPSVPRVRAAGVVPQLLGPADPASARAQRGVPLLRAPGPHADAPAAPARASTCA